MEDQLKALISKYHILVLPVVSILVGIALLGLIIVPQALKIPQTNSEINQNKQTLAIVNQKVHDLDAIDLSQYQSDLDLALTSLPLDQDIPGIFSLISKYLSLDGMQLNSIGVANVSSTATDLTTFKTQVTTGGTRSSLESFINHLSQAVRVMKIDSLSSATGSNSGDKLDVLLTLNGFFLPPPASQNIPADKPIDKLNGQNDQTLAQIKTAVETENALFPPANATNSGAPAGKPDPFQ